MLLRPLSLTARVYFAIAMITLSVAFYFGYAWAAQQRLAEIIHEILDQRIVVMHDADRLKQTMLSDQAALFHFLATQDPADLAQCGSLGVTGGEEIDDLRRLSSSSETRDRLDALQSEVERYFSTAQSLIHYAEKQNLPPRSSLQGAARWARHQGLARRQLDLLSDDSEARLARINSLCDDIIAIKQRQLQDAQTDMARTLKAEHRETASVGAIIGLILLILGGEHIRSVVNPLRRLVKGVQRAESGDFNFEVPVGALDEMGRLIDSFNRMTRSIRKQREQLVRLTITDGLTGLYNQRHFRVLLRQEVERARRAQSSFSLLMIDVDHFKQYNDTRGHELGNELLIWIAATLKKMLRDVDAIARYGGDELVVILPGAIAQEGQLLAERIETAIRECHFSGDHALAMGSVTLSIGGATFPGDATSAEDLVTRADEALYAAKEAGRGCVRWSRPQTRSLQFHQ